MTAIYLFQKVARTPRDIAKVPFHSSLKLSASDPRADVSTRIETGIAAIFGRVSTLRQAS